MQRTSCKAALSVFKITRVVSVLRSIPDPIPEQWYKVIREQIDSFLPVVKQSTIALRESAVLTEDQSIELLTLWNAPQAENIKDIAEETNTLLELYLDIAVAREFRLNRLDTDKEESNGNV